jgi:lipoprotein-anchoring transpeptidase ErfK/SrfK
MLRKFAVVTVALAILATVPGEATATTTKPDAEQQLVLKKKKLTAKKAEEKKKVAAAKQKVVERRRPARRECGSFLECLFGKPHNGSASSARSTSRTSGSVRPDYATAEVVSWTSAAKYAPGSIIVSTPERKLYYVLGDGKARRYKVGVGREGFQWSGTSRIVAKQEWPEWRPPPEMIEREALKGHELPELMEGGPENPLGARAMYIGGTIFRIHGTNNAGSIGGAVSSGCIRMMNTDVMDLYNRVKIGARVYVYQ